MIFAENLLQIIDLLTKRSMDVRSTHLLHFGLSTKILGTVWFYKHAHKSGAWGACPNTQQAKVWSDIAMEPERQTLLFMGSDQVGCVFSSK